MKKLIWIFFALAAELALAAGRLSSVSVSENGTVMLTTGNPNEFKASWSGQAGQYKMIIELPGVTVDKTAKVVGDLAANRGIKNVRFSQFQTEPPVARVIIETPERLSYSWSTKPEGVELHFMLPSPVVTTAKTAPATGFAVPSSVFSQSGAVEPQASTGKKLTPPPASTARQTGEIAAVSKEPKTSAKTSASPSQSPTAKAPATVVASKPSPVVSAPASKAGTAPVLTGTSGATTKTTDSAAKAGTVTATLSPTAMSGKQTVTKDAEQPTAVAPVTVAGPPPPSAALVSGKPELTVKAPVSGPQKESASTSAVSVPQGKTGTTTIAKNTPTAGVSPVPASGGTGVVVKPASPIPGQPSQEKSKTVTGTSTVAPPTSAASTPTVAKPGTTGTPVVSTVTGKPTGPVPATTSATKPADVAKTTGTTTTKSTGTVTSPTGTTATKPTVTEAATDTMDQAKFQEQLKKALGKLETPAQPTEIKPAETGAKSAGPVEKPGQTSFQEQLKQALDPAKSLADTGEVADLDDIDTDLPATDEEEEEPYDTTFAFPGGTFMQVSPSRKVIRYHSEGRRDPFSPLTGRDRYASGKKRRAVPAAEQLRLVGIMRSLGGNKALLEDGEGNGYILAPGDRVRNGYLVSVSENKVLFQVTEYGWTKTVAMELGTLE
jgi:hypothetical protein